MNSCMDGLNEKQREAVTHGPDPLLILAGAGSGKTRVITSRIAWMISEKKFHAPSILAVTFTNKAAAEMRERVDSMLGGTANAMIRTFHSFGAWLLRRNAETLGLSPHFTIYDESDQQTLFTQIFGKMPRKEQRMWIRMIGRAKDGGLSPQDDLTSIHYDPLFPKIYETYEKRLREIGNVDFGDLILLPIHLLRENPEIRNRLNQRFRAVLVDEYQDTNVAQYLLLRELTNSQTWLCVVGDDDQSIYRFRGADVGNILGFSNMFPGTKMIKLEQNYRSTGTILKIASAVISNNAGRLGKTLWTAGDTGDIPVVAFLEDSDEEAEWCIRQIESDRNYGGTAIMYRTNAQSRVFETLLRNKKIPYKLVGTLSFYQREEVKTTLSYIAWIANPRDEVAFRRIANRPTRGLGKIRINQIVDKALREHQGNIREACLYSEFSGKAASGTKFLSGLTIQYASESSESEFEHAGLLIGDILSKTGLQNYYQELDRAENTQKCENLNELITIASHFPATAEGLTDFLESIELNQIDEENSDETNQIKLITVHNAKGLEFDRVIITGMEQNLFPHHFDEFNTSEEEYEEERRLFYVAITRARKQLAFTSCRRRMLWGYFRNQVPSHFLGEIPSDCVRIEGSSLHTGEKSSSWNPGTVIYHDDYGEGIVQKYVKNRSHPVIHVLFESGKRASFIPDFCAGKIEVLKKSG